MSAYEVATLGEGQIRFTVPRGDRLRTARQLRLSPAGSEANVAGLLAQFGHACTWATVLPEGDLGDRILDEYRAVGVDLRHVTRVPSGRVALYFLEPADPPLPSRVAYDRQHTPFREATPDQFDWDSLLDTSLLFVTGITAGLTERTADLVNYAVNSAHERGVAVALDVNYRTLLWSEAQAAATLSPLLDKVTLLLCSRADGNRVFGIEGDGEAVSQELCARTGVAHVVTTDHTNGVFYAGVDGPSRFPVSVVPVLDRPGAGDAFVGGVIHGLLDKGVPAGVRIGQLTAAMALTHYGDLTHFGRADLDLELGGDIIR